MGRITKDTFDPTKAYCNVRLQQGVPLVDADVNELDDIRKFEHRAFLKCYVGDGLPSGNDGFRIEGLPPLEDFLIGAGAQLDPQAPNALRLALTFGRYIVDGLEVTIQNDITYKTQPLHVSQAGANDLAAKYRVPVVQNVPGAGSSLIYLDVWERIVTAVDEPHLLVPPLAIETCARLKREWVVRTRPGTHVPGPGDGDFILGHSYAGIATITRPVGRPDLDITDIRTTALAPAPPTLIPDLLGESASDYAAGLNRPALDLRAAINSYIRGNQVLGTEGAFVFPGLNTSMSQAFAFDLQGGVIAVCANQGQIIATRFDPQDPSSGFVYPSQPQVTSGIQHASPHAVVLPSGHILVVYNTVNVQGSQDVFFNRAPAVGEFTNANETPVAITNGVAEVTPYVVVSDLGSNGGILTFFWHSLAAGPQWVFRRRSYQGDWLEKGATWLDTAAISIPGGSPPALPTTAFGQFHAAVRSNGDIWGAYSAVAGNAPTIQPFVVSATTGAPRPGFLAIAMKMSDGTPDVTVGNPFVAIDSNPGATIFFKAAGGIYLQAYPDTSGFDGPGFDGFDPETVPVPALLPGTTPGSTGPTVAADGQNDRCLFWSTATRQIATMRYTLALSEWAEARSVTGMFVTSTFGTTVTVHSDDSPFVMRSPTGVLWLFWQSSGSTSAPHGGSNAGSAVISRQIFTSI